jgi:hypothetical protein
MEVRIAGVDVDTAAVMVERSSVRTVNSGLRYGTLGTELPTEFVELGLLIYR